MKRRRYTVRSLLLVALAVVFTLGLTQCDSQSGIKTAETAPAKAAPATAAPAPTAMSPSPMNWRTAIANVAQETIPAVVHINISQSREVANPLLPFSNDPFFHFFFNGRKMPRKFKEELSRRLMWVWITCGRCASAPQSSHLLPPTLPCSRFRASMIRSTTTARRDSRHSSGRNCSITPACS